MSHKFLSDEWFTSVESLKNAAKDVEIPAMLQELIINISVTDEEGETQLCLNNGLLQKGHHDAGVATMTLPKDYAYRIFIENDQSAGMSGFMEGKIQVDGDMSKLMSLQAVQPTESLIELQSKIKEATAA